MIEVITPEQADQHIARKRQAVQSDVAEAVATRAAMLERQGIDPALAYSRDVVRELELQQIAQRSDELAERWVRGLFIFVLLGIYFGWLA